jgi:hypothetical protein
LRITIIYNLIISKHMKTFKFKHSNIEMFYINATPLSVIGVIVISNINDRVRRLGIIECYYAECR